MEKIQVSTTTSQKFSDDLTSVYKLIEAYRNQINSEKKQVAKSRSRDRALTLHLTPNNCCDDLHWRNFERVNFLYVNSPYYQTDFNYINIKLGTDLTCHHCLPI